MGKAKNTEEYVAIHQGTFAYDILTKVREIILSTNPKITEDIKWGAPAFIYKGNMIGLVAFKKFVGIWFHKGALLRDVFGLLEASSEKTKAMRKYNVAHINELNQEGLKALVQEAIEKQESGEQVKGFNEKPKASTSALLTSALAENKTAKKTFENFTKAKQQEYIQHVESAKQETTKKRRVQKALDLLEQGLGLHDKYK